MAVDKIPLSALRKDAWNRMLTAGMYIRYHQSLSSWAARLDYTLRLVAAVTSTSTVATSPIWDSEWGKPIIVVVGLIAAIASICLTVLPLKKWDEDNSKFVEEWTPIRYGWEKIFNETDYATEDYFDSAEQQRLLDEQMKIEKRQGKAAWSALLDSCQKAELRSVGYPEETAASH